MENFFITNAELEAMFNYCKAANEEVYSDCGTIKIENCRMCEMMASEVKPSHYEKGIRKAFQIATKKFHK